MPRPERLSWRVLLALLALLVAFGAADVAGDSGALHRRLAQEIIGSKIPSKGLGVSLVALGRHPEEDVVAFAHRPAAAMIPASNVKILTSAAALERLGPDFQLRTSLRIDGRIVDETLLGNLIVVGRGDPGISGRFEPDHEPLATFDRWAMALRRLGIRRVQGDLVLDDTYFDRELLRPDWAERNRGRWFQAPISALTFEDNCIGVRATPTRSGLPANVETVPRTARFEIEGRLTTVAPRRRYRGLVVHRNKNSSTIKVSGSVRQGMEPSLIFTTIDDPAEYFGQVLRETLEKTGITVDGRTGRVARPLGDWGHEVAAHETSVAQAVIVCNQRSQNLFAENLTKTLGHEVRGEGSWSAGVTAIQQVLEPLGVRPENYNLTDGSGLGRESRVPARTLTRALAAMARHRHAELFLESLCTPGNEDCTFGRRMKRVKGAAGNVRVKTGSLNGVRTLSGFVRGRSGQLYAFSLLANAPFGGNDNVHRLQDRFLRVILELG